MDRRVLITSAGSGASNNLMRSLRAGDSSLVIVGCHSDRFMLSKSPADVNYLVPPLGHPEYVATLRWIVRKQAIALVVPNSDADVRAVSAARARIGCRCFLPRHPVIERCQDKYRLAVLLRGRGVPVAETYRVRSLRDVGAIFERLRAHRRLWCRVRRGSGSVAAIPVVSPEQARGWIAYWDEMRGTPVGEFTLSEYLPGRDFAVQGLWKDGALILLKTCERLSYFNGGSQPSGVSSTPAVGKLVFDPRVVDVCRAAIHALGRRASGVFSIDLKENASGVPCVTEINAGRFCMITNIFDLTGTHNMAATYVRLGLDEPVEIRDEYDVTDEYYLVRDLDTLPGIVDADALFEDIHERGMRDGVRERADEASTRDVPDQSQQAKRLRTSAETGAEAVLRGRQAAGEAVSRQRGPHEVTSEAGPTIEITGDLDRQSAEALRLEVLRLARRANVVVDDFRIEQLGERPWRRARHGHVVRPATPTSRSGTVPGARARRRNTRGSR
jgi:hypothetical protein